jgi:hypothetical protein
MKVIRAGKFALPLALLVLAMGCAKESNETQPVTTKTDSGISTAAPAKDAKQRDKALVRVVSAVPGNQAFDLYADDQKVFDSIAFKTVTPYQELSNERHSFRLLPTGQDNAPPAVETGETLMSGKHYTIVVMPDTNDKLKLQVVNDNLVPPATDKAEVRVIHASPDAGEVDVVAKQGNKKLFSGINAGSDTRYTEVDPMTSALEIRPGGKDNALVSLPNAKFDKGKLYTIIVAGRNNGMPKIQAVVIEDGIGTGATASVGD